MSEEYHEPVTINGETFAPVVVPCPSCDAEIDAQRALAAGECPACHTAARDLVHADEGADPPEDYTPESYKVEAEP
jgi:hypothetical protein